MTGGEYTRSAQYEYTPDPCRECESGNVMVRWVRLHGLADPGDDPKYVAHEQVCLDCHGKQGS